MSYPLTNFVTKVFVKQAEAKGYNKEQTDAYVAERRALYQKTAPVGDAITLTALAATAITIAHNSKGTTFKEAAKKQFEPYLKVIKETDIKASVKNTDGFLKTFAKGFKNGVKLAFNLMKGFYKSIPKFIATPAIILLCLNSLTVIMETSKINKKYDALKHIDDKNNK